MPQRIATFESDTTQGVDELVNAFLKSNSDVSVLHMSSSSCWDYDKKYIQYISTILYKYDGD